MFRSTRAAAALTALALLAAACSSGGDEFEARTDRADLPPASASTTSTVATATTTTTVAPSKAQEEKAAWAAVQAFYSAAGEHDWQTVYAAASPAYKFECYPELFVELAGAVTSKPVEVSFPSVPEMLVMGDQAVGSFDLDDGFGVLPIEGQLAVKIEGAWYADVDPCLAAATADEPVAYPVIVTTTTTTTVAPPDPSPDTTTTTLPEVDPTDPITSTTVPPTTTTLPIQDPLTAADKSAIEGVIRTFIVANEAQDWEAVYGASPPLFGASCNVESITTLLAETYFSPTTVTFSPFEISGEADEGFATFAVTYADTGETITVTDFGAWEWGGTWYVAVQPCDYAEALFSNGNSDGFAQDTLHFAHDIARDLYEAVGDYDIPIPALTTLDPEGVKVWVGDPADAGVDRVAYVSDDQKLLLLTQSASGRWFCVALQGTAPGTYSMAYGAHSVDTFEKCKGISLSNPWGPPAA